jgi:2-methylcitrate dehydratase
VSKEGDDFAVMSMHFKLGLYEHQSAGALEGLQKLIYESKFVASSNISDVENIKIIAYEPAFGIIGDPAKKNPTTRQSADHSMVYIISTMLRKAF